MKKLSDIANRKLTVSVGADHGAFEAKNAIAEFLKGAGHEVLDCGAFAFDSEDDYPDFAVSGCCKVLNGEADLTILCCGTGIGMSMAANKLRGIRAACCSEAFSAEMTATALLRYYPRRSGNFPDFPAIQMPITNCTKG